MKGEDTAKMSLSYEAELRTSRTHLTQKMQQVLQV